jgi:hypothetical protein
MLLFFGVSPSLPWVSSIVKQAEHFGYERSLLELAMYYSFVPVLLAGLIILASGAWSGRIPTGLGLVLMGLPDRLLREIFDPNFSSRQLDEFLVAIYVTSVLLLLVGAFRIRGSRSGGPLPALAARGTETSSLRVPRSHTTALSRAEERRERILEQLIEVCQTAKVPVVWYRSAPSASPTWFTVDLDVKGPASDLTIRSQFQITIDALEFHRFENPITITVTRGPTKMTLIGALDVPAAMMRDFCAWGIGNLTSFKLRATCMRQHFWQLWRPRNKVTRLHLDWFSLLFASACCATLAIPIIGMALAPAGALILWLFNRHRITYVLTSGKPVRDPRYLTLMDSWQTNVDGLGQAAGPLQDEILATLRSNAPLGVEIEKEAIAYQGVDGKVERTQIVATYRRAIAFLHLEPYGGDLYVGWDSHSNTGTWMEATVGSGIDRQSGKLVIANRVIPATQRLNEYDLTDINFLTEWLHRNLARVVRTKLAEAKIDQEIDFTILRESRRNVIAPEAPAARQGLLSRIRRTA